MLLTDTPPPLQCKTQTVFNNVVVWLRLYISQCAERCKKRPEATKQASDCFCVERGRGGVGVGGQISFYWKEEKDGRLVLPLRR